APLLGFHPLLLGRFLGLFDVIDGVLDGLDLLRVLVGDLNVEGFLELHDELDDVERVGAEVLLEACAGGDFGLIHLKLLNDNLFYLFIYCCHFFLLFAFWFKIRWDRAVRGAGMCGVICTSLKDTERLGECKAKEGTSCGSRPASQVKGKGNCGGKRAAVGGVRVAASRPNGVR